MATRKKTKWTAYYDDGGIVSSNDCAPKSLPPFGLICIVQKKPDEPRNIMHGWDWYYWHPSDRQWWGCDLPGLIDRLLHRLPVEAVLMGRTVSVAQFNETMTKADADHNDWLHE